MDSIINMTIAGTVTAITLLIIKWILRDKLTPNWHCMLWLILAVRLLIPGLPESDFSLLNSLPLPAAHHVAAIESNENPSSVKPAGDVVQNSAEGNLILKTPVAGSTQTKAYAVTEQRTDAAAMIWIAVSLSLAGFLTAVYLAFCRRARRLAVCTDPEILELLDECKREAEVFSHKITLRFGSNTPMLHGFLHPNILVPEGYNRNELRHIFLHELCHYKHKDVVINVICCAFLCAYWFNPIFWLCFFAIRRDLEILCDERAIEISKERKEYAAVLLKTALRKNQFLFATTSMQNGEKEVSRRIQHIAYFKKPKLWISTLAVAVVLVIGLVCLTNASAKETVNLDAGGGYFYQVPEAWVKQSAKDTLFYNQDGEIFGGVSMVTVDLGGNKNSSIETISLPIPDHSQILERKVVKEAPFSYVIINLDLKNRNQNHIFLWSDKNTNQVYTIWANSSEVTDGELIKIAKTFRENPYPQGYQPEREFQDDWIVTGDFLLNDYFQNYVDAELSMSSDINGYHIGRLEPYQDAETSWSVIYPDAAVLEVDYTLDIAYPDCYSFPGGGFQIGEENRTKIYQGELAIFQKDWKNDVKFLGFVWPQDRGDLGDSQAILHTINARNSEKRAAALLDDQTPYIGNASKVGSIIANMPLFQYSKGMELHTKEEPFGVTVNYDLTKTDGIVFDDGKRKALTNSSGWEPSADLKAQLFQNSATLLSLIDNCSYVHLKVIGIAAQGVPYTYDYFMDRETLEKELGTDARLSTKNTKDYCEFLMAIEAMKQY